MSGGNNRDYRLDTASNWTIGGATATTYPGQTNEGDVVDINPASTGVQTVTISGTVNIGSLSLGDAGDLYPITISGGTLGFSVSSGSAGLTETGGTGDTISSAVNLASNLSVTVTPPTGVVSSIPLTISGSIGGAGGLSMTAGNSITSATKLELTGVNTYSGGTTINSGVIVGQNTSALGTKGVVKAGGTLSLPDGIAATASAVTPISLASSSFNANVVYTPSEAYPANNAATTLGGYIYYEVGADPNATTYGLPTSGTIISTLNSNVTYQLQSYSANNVLLLYGGGTKTGVMSFQLPHHIPGTQLPR